MWGNCTGAATNWQSENLNPPAFDTSYVSSNTSGIEDLYTFAGLTETPSAIYTVGVKGFIRKTDTGTRTVDLRTKSGTTDVGGSNTNITPATTYGWLSSYFDIDPNTSAAWTPNWPLLKPQQKLGLIVDTWKSLIAKKGS